MSKLAGWGLTLICALASGLAQENAKKLSSDASAAGITQKQAQAILGELRAIHKLLASENRTANAPLPQKSVSKVELNLRHGWYSMGRSDAPVTVVEFADYQCPFCRQYHAVTFPEIKKNYIDTGKVRFISRDMPLDFHDRALRAAEAARCAGEQEKFWELRDFLIANSNNLSDETIQKGARTLGLDLSTFQLCVNSETHKADIEKDLADATSLQISGTPTFVIGRATSDLLKGVLLVGAQPYSTFESVIQEAMKAAP